MRIWKIVIRTQTQTKPTYEVRKRKACGVELEEMKHLTFGHSHLVRSSLGFYAVEEIAM